MDLPLVARGKVREIYDAGDDRLLLVASDRISAYDHVLTTPIPDKGRVLTAMSVFWFEEFADLTPNHLVAWDDPRIPAEVRGRALLVRRLDMVQVECVARGYLTGSGMAEYRQDQGQADNDQERRQDHGQANLDGARQVEDPQSSQHDQHRGAGAQPAFHPRTARNESAAGGEHRLLPHGMRCVDADLILTA